MTNSLNLEKCVAYIHTTNWPSDSPSFQFVSFNAYGMAQAGLRTHLFVKDNSNEKSAEIFFNRFKLELPENLRVHRLKSRHILYAHRHFFKQVMGTLLKLHQNEPLKAVITRSIEFLPNLVLLKEKLGVPVFYEIHDCFADLSRRTDIINKRKYVFKERLEREYIPSVDALIFLQSSQQMLYSELFPGVRGYIAHTGLMQKDSVPVEKENIISYIGSLDKHKGVFTLIRALASLDDRDIKLLIIGGRNRKEIDTIMAFSRELNIDHRIEITGWVPYKEISGLLSKVKYGCVPLENTFFNRFLTSPLKILDYYANGVPVITNSLESVNDYISNGVEGFTVKDPDYKNWTEILKFAFSDKVDYWKLVEAVRARAESLTWEKRGIIIAKILEKMAGTS
ncbi:glycosyltransferase [bacterium]|nr:glycosyltransferase [bacterium]